MIAHLRSERDFGAFVQAHHRCVVKASAGWCRPCRKIAPLFESLSNAFPALWFGQVDVDVVQQPYPIDTLPTFLFFQDGQPVRVVRGAAPERLRTSVTEFATAAGGAR